MSQTVYVVTYGESHEGDIVYGVTPTAAAGRAMAERVSRADLVWETVDAHDFARAEWGFYEVKPHTLVE